MGQYDLTNADRYVQTLGQHLSSAKHVLDLIENEIGVRDKKIQDLKEQIDVLRLQIKVSNNNGTEVPDPGEVYDEGEEFDNDGRIHPYILPFNGAFRYTRSKFEFLKECSRILVEAGKMRAPIKDQCGCLVDAGVPFESIVWSMRLNIKDCQKLLTSSDSEIYPYLRTQFQRNFQNVDADWHWIHFAKEMKERVVLRKEFAKEESVEEPQEQEQQTPPAPEEKPVVEEPVKEKVIPPQYIELTQSMLNALKQDFINSAPVNTYEKVMSILDKYKIPLSQMFADIFGHDGRCASAVKRYKKLTDLFITRVNEFCGCDVVNCKVSEKKDDTSSGKMQLEFTAEQIIAMFEKCEKDIDKIREFVTKHGYGSALVRFNGVFRNFIYRNKMPRIDTIMKINRALGKDVLSAQSPNYPLKSDNPDDYKVLNGKTFHNPVEFKKFLIDNGLSQTYLANRMGVIKQTFYININRCASTLKKFLLEEYNCTIDW